jgi:mono/diheme cytochrome c family protein
VVVTATAAAGRLKYDADCASCHAAGSYDTSAGSGASDLFNKGNLVITDISSYSNKKSNVDDLTDQEVLDLRAFLDHPSIAP